MVRSGSRPAMSCRCYGQQTLQTKLARGRLVQYRQAVYLRQELSQLESRVRSIYEGGLLA